jgi:hypothetical protein
MIVLGQGDPHPSGAHWPYASPKPARLADVQSVAEKHPLGQAEVEEDLGWFMMHHGVKRGVYRADSAGASVASRVSSQAPLMTIEIMQCLLSVSPSCLVFRLRYRSA